MMRAPLGDRLGDLGADLLEARGQRRAAAVDVVEAAGHVGDEARHVAVTVDVPDLDQLVVGDHRERQHTWRHDAGVGSSRLASGPMVPLRLVTSSSRIASSGGLVTWANSCAK